MHREQERAESDELSAARPEGNAQGKGKLPPPALTWQYHSHWSSDWPYWSQRQSLMLWLRSSDSCYLMAWSRQTGRLSW